jgi:hypothetical protein
MALLTVFRQQPNPLPVTAYDKAAGKSPGGLFHSPASLALRHNYLARSLAA